MTQTIQTIDLHEGPQGYYLSLYSVPAAEVTMFADPSVTYLLPDEMDHIMSPRGLLIIAKWLCHNNGQPLGQADWIPVDKVAPYQPVARYDHTAGTVTEMGKPLPECWLAARGRRPAGSVRT